MICTTTFLIAAVAQSHQKSVLLSTDQDIELIGAILLLSGFYNRKGFILSQHPLDSTISSMWQMVAEQEIQVIVVLTNLDNQVMIKEIFVEGENSKIEYTFNNAQQKIHKFQNIFSL